MVQNLGKFSLGLIVAGLSTMGACSKIGSAIDELESSVSETAGSSLAGAAQSSESTGSMAALDSTYSSSLASKMNDSMFPIANASASSVCPGWIGSSCSSGVITMTYNSCSFANSAAVWNGSQIITFTSGSCTLAPESGGVTFTRTVGSGTTRTSAGGTVLAIDTTTASGYATPVSGGTTVVASGGNRAITINGIHYVATGKSGKTLFDHTVSATGVTVVGPGPSRSITAGTTTVQHNLAKYSAVATITSPLTFQAACCHPVGGSISSTLSGSKTGTETMTFGPSCGSATLTSTDGTSSTITINHCL